MIWKRFFDLIISAVLLVLLLPVILTVCIAVYLITGPPIFFRQQRPGYLGRAFFLYKFRTMTWARNTQGTLLNDAARLTPLGRLLRKFSLDELPQLFNVLKGDMSLVGPRPLLMDYLPLYTPDQARRHEVKPGITGWAQIKGRNAISWEERFALDLWYVENRSFGLDLKILWLTLIKVIRSEGISQKGHATMPEFKGGTKKTHERL